MDMESCHRFPIIVSFDGNIGSGKSTTLEKYKEYYKSITSNNATIADEEICFVQEPVDEWLTVFDHEGTHILENLYKNTKKFAFRFQMMAYISRLALLRRAARNPKVKVIVTERSVETDRNVFAKMLYDSGDIEHDEFIIYNKWFNEFLDDLPVEGIVYIRAQPATCIERIEKRARSGETIDPEYINRCHLYHDRWICNEGKRVLYLEADKDALTDEEHFDDRMKRIFSFINELMAEQAQK